MSRADDMRTRIQRLFAEQQLGVLATHGGVQPYASLVAFAASDDLRHLTFVTPRTTRKFANLEQDAHVALLVNDSTNRQSDFHRAIAVTAVGDARETAGGERERLLRAYLERHPHLEDFARAPTCALLRIDVRTYFLVKQFQHVTELHMQP